MLFYTKRSYKTRWCIPSLMLYVTKAGSSLNQSGDCINKRVCWLVDWYIIVKASLRAVSPTVPTQPGGGGISAQIWRQFSWWIFGSGAKQWGKAGQKERPCRVSKTQMILSHNKIMFFWVNVVFDPSVHCWLSFSIFCDLSGRLRSVGS